MRSKIATVMIVFLLAGLAWAGEPWKTKSPQDWTDKEVNQILNDSPWARTITAPASWLRTGRQGLEVGTKMTLPASRNPNQVEDPDLKSPPPVHDKLYDQYARFLLRWETSRSVRAASARKRMLQGIAQAEDPEGELAGVPFEYELHLFGDALAPFPIATEDQLKANTFLVVVGTARKVEASQIRVRRRDDGQIVEVRFYFPKTNRSGEPLFTGKENAIEFQCFVGGTQLRARFDPKQMVDRQGLDL